MSPKERKSRCLLPDGREWFGGVDCGWLEGEEPESISSQEENPENDLNKKHNPLYGVHYGARIFDNS